MKFYQERIEMDSGVPARIYLGTAQGGNCHYPLHWHESLEFNLVLKGAIRGKINGKPVYVPQGGLFFVNSGDLHETDAENKNEMSAITLLLSYDLIREYLPDAEAYCFDLGENREAQEKAIALVQECAVLYRYQQACYPLEMAILLRRILLLLLKECLIKKQEAHYSRYGQKNLKNIKKAIAYMEAHYSEALSLKETAAQIGMAPTYFSRFIRKTTDETFYAYLTKIRLYHAYQELISHNASITEIALNNGFQNVKAFIEAFKRAYLETPDKYRRQVVQKNQKPGGIEPSPF